MESLFKFIGIDDEDIQWYHLASCNGMTTSYKFDWFYDLYETDKEVAKQVVCSQESAKYQELYRKSTNVNYKNK